MKEYGVIYILINKINSKCYVGQTTRSFNTRIAEYQQLKCKNQIFLYNAIKKHSFDNFTFQILAKAENQNQLNELESFYIDAFDSIKNGYNLKEGGSNGKHSFLSKNKMSLSHLGSKNHMYGRTGSKAGFFGKKHKPENMIKQQSGNAKRKISVFCIETKEIFSSISEAAYKLNLNIGSISRLLKGKAKQTKGYSFVVLP